MAFVIISAGRLAHSHTLTVGARPLALLLALSLLLLLGAGAGLGYGLAQLRAGSTGAATGPLALDPDQPEARALLDQLGAIAGRLSRLEGEAAALARRLGRGSEPQPAATSGDAAGGPFLPALSGSAARGGSTDDLLRLEAWLANLETTFDQLGGEAVAHELEDMAFPYRLPVLGEGLSISSRFGMRRDPFTGAPARHAGIDIPAAPGTPILASGGGRVVSAGYNGAYGRTVIVDHGDGLRTLYGHASKLLVRAGDVVMPRQPIALVGSSGRSSGPHLHFEVIRDGRRVDPSGYLAQVLPAGGAP